MTEAQTNHLQTILDEFKTLSPETANVLIFNNDCQTVASIGPASEDQTKKLASNFGDVTQQAQIIGGVNNLIIQTADSQLTIAAMGSLYLATVSLRAANPEVVKSLTQVVIPTVAKLIDRNVIVPTRTQCSTVSEVEDKSEEKGVETVLPRIEEPSVEPIPETNTAYELLPSTPVNQFMVEKIGGLLVQPDTVRIDGEVMAKWSELFDGKQILAVNIEGLDGKKTTCKVKPIKDAKNCSKGIIQIPEKILQNLQTEKGKLVMVGPAIK